MTGDDPRRSIPRTDVLLGLPEVLDARDRLGEIRIRGIIHDVQARARRGELAPSAVGSEVVAAVRGESASSLGAVLNATGVIVHTNLGRAPLSDTAVAAVVEASGYVDVELDLASGKRSTRGVGVREALVRACPAAGDTLVVNNGAAALMLACTAFAAGREVVISRGEMIEIGAGFRLTDLIVSTGVRLREVGTTNRTHLRDYADAFSPAGLSPGAGLPPGAGQYDPRSVEHHVGAILKVHPSNFRVQGFTASAGLSELRDLAHQYGVPLIVDLGSGLLHHDQALPDEPDATSALEAGADVVIASGDKLLGGPQAGILLGDKDVIARLATHPLARAVRTDKLTLAALEATLTGPQPPVTRYLHVDPERVKQRTERLAGELGVPIVECDGRVGGGGAPGVRLPGWALRLPVSVAGPLRTGDPAVLARVHADACLVDLRCIPERDDERLLTALRAQIPAS